MARIWRHRAAIGAGLWLLLGLALVPAHADDQGLKDRTDLYDRPVLAIDPGMHTGVIRTQAVDAGARFAVTGSHDHTVRIWSIADGKLLRTIWIPQGPDFVGRIFAVAISPDGSTIAAGGWTERLRGDLPIYLFDREFGDLIRRIHGDLPDVAHSLAFSPDGRYLAATIGNGLRIFDRDKDWTAAFREGQYGGDSYGAMFSPEGRLVTTSYDRLIRRYAYDATSDHPNFRRVGEPLEAPSGDHPRGVAFCRDGTKAAVGYNDVAAVDILDGATLERLGGHRPADARASPEGLDQVAWSDDCQTLLAVGAVNDQQSRRLLFAWDGAGLGDERRMTYCGPDFTSGLNILPNSRILVASELPCLGLMEADGKPIWTVTSPVLDLRGQWDIMRVAEDGRVVDFGYLGSPVTVFRFDLRSLTLSSPPPSDSLTFPPSREGLTIDGWQDGTRPTLGGQDLPFHDGMARSLAIAPDAKRFFLSSAGPSRRSTPTERKNGVGRVAARRGR